MSFFIPREQLTEAYNTVAATLGATPLESIGDAALRVFRQNCGKPVQLEVARLVLEMHGKPADEQWKTLQRAAQVARGAEKPN